MDDAQQQPVVTEGQSRTRRLVVAGLAAAAVAMTIYFAVAMPGMDHDGGSEHDSPGTEVVEDGP